jgi:hypothetical protein
MMEKWNVGILGMKSGKWAILQEMMNLQYLMMPVRHQFSAFVPISIPSKLNNQRKSLRVDFFFKPIIPLFHDSHCERSELTCTSGGGYSASACALRFSRA